MPEDPQDKKTPARRLQKRFAQIGADLAHDSPDDEENDDEESALVTRTRNPIKAAKPSKLETSSRGEETPKEEAGKAPMSPEAEIVPPSSTTIPEGVNAKTPNANKNAPSETLGATTTCHSLSLLTYSEGAIKEANALRKLDPRKVIEDNPFQGCYAGIEDADDLNDVSAIFEEAQHLLSRPRLNLSSEALKRRVWLRKENRGVGAELAKAQAEAAQAKVEAVQAKAETEKTKAATDKSIAIYSREAEAVQAKLRAAAAQGRRSYELAKCQAQRETLEEIHARGFNLTGEIAEAKARETDARFLISYDDEDMVRGSGDEEDEEDILAGEGTPEDRAAEDVVSEDDTPEGLGEGVSMRPTPPSKEGTSKPGKGKKRKKEASVESPKSEKPKVHRSQTDATVLTLAVVESCDDDDDRPLVQRARRGADAPQAVGRKVAELGMADGDLSPTEETFEEGSCAVPELQVGHGTVRTDETLAGTSGGPDPKFLWVETKPLQKLMPWVALNWALRFHWGKLGMPRIRVPPVWGPLMERKICSGTTLPASTRTVVASPHTEDEGDDDDDRPLVKKLYDHAFIKLQDKLSYHEKELEKLTSEIYKWKASSARKEGFG
ncbi:uncharacterized protein [Nicotiana sylvestris]|uniref:uncharacterized protein n=1 Tax=Nicotiana sylvestris TaxID=4096 RepID=UPI00388C9770